MRTRFFSICFLFAVAAPWAAGNKSQPAVQSNVGAAGRMAPGMPASLPSSGRVHFTGDVKRGETFEKVFAANMMFRLEPYAGNDSGWTIRIVPGAGSAATSVDCIGAVAEPLHGNKNVLIDPPADGTPQRLGHWGAHEFDFVPTAAECKVAWDLMNVVNYSSKLSDRERENTDAKLGRIPKGHGTLTIVDSRLDAPTATNEHGVIEWLKFAVDLSVPAATPQPVATLNEPKTETAENGKGLRGINLTEFLSAHYSEVQPDLADLETECGEEQKPIQGLAPFQYADLDGDGQEEAVFQGLTCMSGTAGVDFFGVLKMTADGKIVALAIEGEQKEFKGRKNLYEGLRGHLRLEIKQGRLLEIYPVYTNEKACNNCAEGGERDFLYRWDGQKFVLDDIIDVPPDKGDR